MFGGFVKVGSEEKVLFDGKVKSLDELSKVVSDSLDSYRESNVEVSGDIEVFTFKKSEMFISALYKYNSEYNIHKLYKRELFDRCNSRSDSNMVDVGKTSYYDIRGFDDGIHVIENSNIVGSDRNEYVDFKPSNRDRAFANVYIVYVDGDENNPFGSASSLRFNIKIESKDRECELSDLTELFS